MQKFIFMALLAFIPAEAQTTQVLKDGLGNPMVEVAFPPSFGPCDTIACKVRFKAKNVSGLTISKVWLDGTVRWDHPTQYLTFSPAAETLAPGATTELTANLIFPLADDRPTIHKIDLQLSSGFKSPQEKQQAEERAKKEAKELAEARARLTAACADVYRQTIDKPAKDLTVREETNIAYCQSKGWYAADPH